MTSTSCVFGAVGVVFGPDAARWLRPMSVLATGAPVAASIVWPAMTPVPARAGAWARTAMTSAHETMNDSRMRGIVDSLGIVLSIVEVSLSSRAQTRRPAARHTRLADPQDARARI